MFATSDGKEAVLLQDMSRASPNEWDDSTTVVTEGRFGQDDNRTFTGNDDNMSGLMKVLPPDVTEINFWFHPFNTTGMNITNDVPVHISESPFVFVLSGTKLRTTEGIGLNFSSLSVTYAYVVLMERTVIFGIGERGYNYNYLTLGQVEYSEWSWINIELGKSCLTTTLNNGEGQRLCGDFARERIGFEFQSNKLDNVTVYGHQQDAITQSATTLGFSEVSIPSYFVMISVGFSLFLVIFLIMVLKEDTTSTRSYRIATFLLLLWSIIMVGIFLRIVIL
jgi:hypothetical protein